MYNRDFSCTTMAKKSTSTRPGSDTAIEKLKPAPKDYDTIVAPNLYVRVAPNGRKSWLFRYNQRGVQKNKIIGTHPAMKFAVATAEALQLKEKTRSGVDLKAEKEAADEAAEKASKFTVEYVVRDWLETTAKRKHWKDITRQKVTRQFEMYLLDVHGKKQFGALTASDVVTRAIAASPTITAPDVGLAVT